MWFDLILRSFQAQFIFPLHTETTYYAMLAFGTQPLVMVFAGGLLGGLLGAGVNLLLGAVLSRGNLQRDHPSMIKVQKSLERFGVWLLAIPGLPLLGIITVIMATAGVRPQRIALPLAIGIFLNYAITAFITGRSEILVALLRAASH